MGRIIPYIDCRQGVAAVAAQKVNAVAGYYELADVIVFGGQAIPGADIIFRGLGMIYASFYTFMMV